MSKFDGASPERLADHFISYLFERYSRNRHVRRVASWVGFIVQGIEKAGGTKWRVPRERQLAFEYGGKIFKARFNHKAGPRGGIEIVEMLPGRGSPEGEIVIAITNLDEAENFYVSVENIMRQFTRKS